MSISTGTGTVAGSSELARRWRAHLLTEVDGASVALFRIGFGAIIFWEVLRYVAYGRIYRYYIEPRVFFSYVPFIKPWGGSGMYLHFALLGALALLCAAGLFYRVAAPLLCAVLTYVFLLDKAQYLNHFYLICLLSLLLAVMPAHRAFSLDRLRGRAPPGETVPRWCVLVLRAQVALVYFYGGLAKLNPDWLRGEPMGMWLAERADLPLIGPWLALPGAGLLFSYAGLLIDLSAPFLLSFRRTLPIGVAACVLFNLVNEILFKIGVFPYVMIAALVLFPDPGWPRRLIGKAPAHGPPADGAPAQILPHRLGFALLHVYMLVQVAVPLRHWLYPGDVNWTEEGHRFSWRMKLRDKQVDELAIHVVDPRTGFREPVALEHWLTEHQIAEAATRPDMIIDFARMVADRAHARSGVRPMVTAKVSVSLNGGPYRDLVDSRLDLAAR